MNPSAPVTRIFICYWPIDPVSLEIKTARITEVKTASSTAEKIPVNPINAIERMFQEFVVVSDKLEP